MAEWGQRLSVIWHCSYRERVTRQHTKHFAGSQRGWRVLRRNLSYPEEGRPRAAVPHTVVDYELSSNNSQDRQLQQLISRFVEGCST